jgi:hypothetical protein
VSHLALSISSATVIPPSSSATVIPPSSAAVVLFSPTQQLSPLPANSATFVHLFHPEAQR